MSARVNELKDELRRAVARALGISVHTVKFHLEALFNKLDATSRAEAVAKGLRGGVIEL